MSPVSSLPPVDDHARLLLLYEVSQTLGSSLDLTTVLNRVMDAIIRLTGAERGFLMMVNRERGGLDVRAARNLDQETIAKKEMDISRTVIQRVVETGEVVVTSNAQDDPRFADQSSVIGYALRSIMCAPLRARGETIGAVYVDNRIRSGIFSKDDLAMLAAFANQAAIAIENARLFTMTDQALAARVKELSVLQEIDRELNTELDLPRVIDLTLEWAVKLAMADSGLLLLLEPDVDSARVAASRGASPAPERVALEHPVIARVLASGETVLTRAPRLAESVDGTPAAIQLAVPVKREGRVIGLISLENGSGKGFGQDRVEFLERLADHAAIALENARLYDAVSAANKAKSTFVSVVSHELRIPMTSIKGYTDMLKSGAVGPVSDMQREFLTTIRRNVDRMNVLVSDLADINRIESGRLRLNLDDIRLEDAVAEALAGLQAQFEAKDQPVKVDIPDSLPPVYADHGRVVQIVSNLLSNASKYSANGREVELTAGLETRDDGVPIIRVSVIDQGIGIAAEDQAKLFSQFFRSEDQDVRDQTGWGLGLSIVKMMVEAQAGEVGVSSVHGQGSTFEFTLPVARKS